MKRRLAFAFLVVLLVPALSEAATTKKDIHLTSGVKNRNVLPRVTAGEDGDFTVVWTQQIAGTKTVRIFAKTVHQNADGSRTVGKLRRVSPKTGWNANAHISWVPWLNRYIVVWDDFDFTGPIGGNRILGRALFRDGRVASQIVELYSSARGRTWPQTFVFDANPDANRAKQTVPATERAIFLAHTALPTKKGQGRTGIAITRLGGRKLKRLGATTTIFPVKVIGKAKPVTLDTLDRLPFISGRMWWERGHPADPDRGFGGVGMGVSLNTTPASTIAGAAQGTFGENLTSRPIRQNENPNLSGLAMTWVSDDLGNWVLSARGQRLDDRYRGDVSAAPTAADNGLNTGTFGHRRSLFVVGNFQAQFRDDIENGDLDGYLLIGKDTDIDGSYLPRNYDNDIPGQNADLPIRRNREPQPSAAGDVFAHVYYPRDNRIYRRNLVDNGAGFHTLAPKETMEINHKGAMSWLEADSHPESGLRVMVWGKRVNAANEKVWVHIY